MDNISLFEYFICGGFAGICTVLIGHPFDTIKVRMQISKASHLSNYSGTWACFKKIIRNESFKGLYKGMGAPLTGVAPIFSISFMGYGTGKLLFNGVSEKGNMNSQYFMAGAFSSIFTTVVMAPGERIKCLLQIQEGKLSTKLYNGPIDVIKKLYKQGGINSLYRGAGVTLLRDVPASGFYFLTYEVIRNHLTDAGKHEPGVIGTILAGGLAGVANWIVGTPADVLKTRLQTAPEGTYPNGVRDVFKDLIKHEGVSALYKGITPVLLRAFPANAACFLGFEFSKNSLHYIKSINDQ